MASTLPLKNDTPLISENLLNGDLKVDPLLPQKVDPLVPKKVTQGSDLRSTDLICSDACSSQCQKSPLFDPKCDIFKLFEASSHPPNHHPGIAFFLQIWTLPRDVSPKTSQKWSHFTQTVGSTLKLLMKIDTFEHVTHRADRHSQISYATSTYQKNVIDRRHVMVSSYCRFIRT